MALGLVVCVAVGVRLSWCNMVGDGIYLAQDGWFLALRT